MLSETKKLVLDASRRSRARFEATLGGSFEERGILNSEMLAVCALCEALGADVIIESGRWKGQSTAILAQYFVGSKTVVESVEAFKDENAKYVESKLSHFDNLGLHYGDANVVLPRLVKKHRGKKIAILLDGPKGAVAINLFKLALTYSPDIVVGFFHDMRRPGPRTPSEGRGEMVVEFPETFYTDDEEFVAEFGAIDATCKGDWQPYEICGEALGSYGPTIGVVLPEPKDFEASRRDRRALIAKTIIPRARLLGFKIKHRANRLFRSPGD